MFVPDSPPASIGRMSWIRNRRTLLIAASALVIIGVGTFLGVTLSGGGTSPPHKATTTSSSIPATSPTVDPPSTLPPQSGLPNCKLPEVSVSIGPSATVSGHTGFPVVFTNTSKVSCQLYGYPVVTAYDAAGKRVAVADQLPGGFVGGLGPNGVPAVVKLHPGLTASAAVEAAGPRPSGPPPSAGSKVPTTTTRPCAAVASLVIALPGNSATVSEPVSLTYCYAFLVHPFVSGSTGT